MKCDELKEVMNVMQVSGEHIPSGYYKKHDVDAVLSEKDREIALLKERICNGDVSRLTWIDDYIAKDKEIAELKEKLEDVQASMYADVVDANMDNRRLKRALWLARAQAADGFATISRWTDYEDMHPDTKLGYRKWYKKFMHVKALCRAKAEAYK